MTVTLLPPPAAGTSAPGAPPLDELTAAMIGPTVVINMLPVEGTGKTHCDACGHTRKLHSRNGCVESGCSCSVTYMDLCAG